MTKQEFILKWHNKVPTQVIEDAISMADDERAKVLEEIKNGTYAKENGKCPICYDCPKNCPLENIK